TDRSWAVHLRKIDGKWKAVSGGEASISLKKPGMQGPIDDAFLDSFLFVLPTGKPLNDKAGAWVEAESKRAVEHWRKQFRGEARVKKDSEVTDEDIKEHNLVLWGDPSSNKLLAKALDRLPLKWTGESVTLGKGTFAAGNHVPVLIYPNPLN